MAHKRQPLQTIPIATVTEAEPEDVTIFAEVGPPTPTVGSVWGAYFDGNQQVAEDFYPDGTVVIYGVSFRVDPLWKAVTWYDGSNVLGSRDLPVLNPATAGDSPSGTTEDGRGTTAGTSDAPFSGSGTGAAPAEGSGTSDPEPSAKPKSKGSIGPIVGGVVGGVIVLASIIFLVWFLLRRRKRRRQAGAGPAQQNGPPRTDDEQYPVESHTGVGTHHTGFPPTTNGLHPAEQHAGAGVNKGTAFPSTTEKCAMEYPSHSPTQHHAVPELPYHGLNRSDIPAHELDPAKGSTAVMNAHELEHGPVQQPSPPAGIKRVPVPASELQSNGNVVFRHELGDEGSRAEYAAQPQSQQQEQTHSPHVDAQRRREIEWLESEEAKLRSRRELLRQQGQGRSG